MRTTFSRRLRHASISSLTFALSLALFPVYFSGGRADARAPERGAVAGIVTSADGAPVAGACVTLRGGAAERTVRTDGSGHFALSDLDTGSYAVRVAAPGYNTLSNRVIGVSAGTAVLALTVVRSSSSLVTIGRVQANGGDALSTASVPSTTLSPQQYAERGYTRVSDVLQDDISTTLVHRLGGSSVLPTAVALRGPDPTETLIDIDGHQVNSGNTGDFDLSLLDPADYGSIELVKGISPSSLVGPDTIDGAINIRTLDPTTVSHGSLRLNAGSFNSFGETLESTGTIERLGYAFSLHKTTTGGEVNQTIFDTSAGTPAQVGSAVDGSTALGKLRYAFGHAGDGYVQLSFHDQSQFRDLSAALSSVPASSAAGASSSSIARGSASSDSIASGVLRVPSDAVTTLPALNGLEGTALQAHNSGLGLDLRLPLGPPDAAGVTRTSALFRHYSALVSQSLSGPGAQTSPFLYNDRDAIHEDTLELDHQFGHAALTFQYGLRNEALTTNYLAGVVNDQSVARRSSESTLLAQAIARISPRDTLSGSGKSDVSTLSLAQTQRSSLLRYTYDPSARLHLTVATYYSNYSIFGTSFDPRFGVAYDPDARSVLRFSIGTTYQAPQLPELYVPPLLPAPVGGYVSVGNPNLKPDHATEYGFGVERVLETGRHRTDVSVDVYRVNLRQPAATYRQPQVDPFCGDRNPCPLSYTINAGDAIYSGIEIAAQRRLAPYTMLRAGYAVRSAYLTSVPPGVQNGTLVAGEQTLGLPLQKATLALRSAPPLGFGFDAGLVYEGLYNELNQPQFAVLNAGVSYRRRGLEFGVAATNITNVYDQGFTRTGRGVSYAGLNGPLATDAYALQGTAFTFSIGRRF